jgi:hypothetical protein
MHSFLLALRRPAFAVLFLLPLALPAQDKPGQSKPGQSPKPGPTGPEKFTREQIEEIVSKLHDRIGKAADYVMGRLQKAENDIFMRFGYFQKADRLDPNAYASRDEVSQWQQSLKELKQKQDALEQLYSNADHDLGGALLAERIDPRISEQVKKELLQTFPWDTIKKKNQLMQQYLVEHGQLLTFYNKNWGTWKHGANPPTFENQQLNGTYQDLKTKITTLGDQVADQYRALRGTTTTGG